MLFFYFYSPFELSFIKFLKSRKNTREEPRKEIEHRVKFSNIDLEIHMINKANSKTGTEHNHYLDSDRVWVERIPHQNIEQYNVNIYILLDIIRNLKELKILPFQSYK